jgi:Helix-turn-helix domain
MTNYFELFDKRLTAIEARQDEILSLAKRAISPATAAAEETPLTVEQAADFLNIAPQTVYQNIKKIPNRKKHGRLFFFRSELLAYLESGKGAVAK